MRGILAQLLLAATLAGASAPARADDRPLCGAAPSDREVRARLRVVERHVREQEPLVRRWFTTFALLHATMAAGAAILAAQADQDEGFRSEMLVDMTSSALGLASLLVTLPPLLGAGGSLEAMSARTPAARLARLRAGEDVLRRAANAVRFVHGWFPATASAVYVTSASTVLLAGYGRLGAAYGHALGGTVLGLGRILLRPSGAADAWRRYRRAHPDAACEPAPRASSGASIRIAPAGLGIGLVGRF